MAFNNIETHVLEMIGESTSAPDVFTDTDSGIEPIRESIGDAIEEITMLTGSYQAIYRMPLIEGQGFYRLRLTNGSIGWITDAWLVNEKYRLCQTDETKVSYQNPRWMVNQGSPREYFQIGKDVIGVYPRPSGSSDLLELTVVVIPKKYTSGVDRLYLRDAFKWGAVHYAVSEYYASVGDAKSATDHHQKYLENIGFQSLHPKGAERVPFYKTIKQ
jgi:hypothetical protein